MIVRGLGGGFLPLYNLAPPIEIASLDILVS
jgi:hypothetical protein